MGYVGVITNTILQHLYDNYGVITAVDIEDNDTAMRAEYDLSQPIEVLLYQIEIAVQFSEAGKSPYEPKQVVSRAYLLVLKLVFTRKLAKIGKLRRSQIRLWFPSNNISLNIKLLHYKT